ncbi:ferredoxin-like protein [Thermacetogenium phaeum DSM 12270]|uniref:Ferredoxin-like protein n=1 Tax=Thermacetogenium phaeum (strain ATCC BAA-254 / DSM 26808 / PB) TaxID=1089553 RepID=K4LIZ9_THEPS|nr:(2Fe-2S) ferredoxin domain-containing protein [Thermacetogenium phaeum]AFV12042.1 ferredoxin-like protein [Thermacetogenium phaeum DSM 12270]MDN5375950.1 NADP-reducing hydrogenase subunit HndB [Thermacetogenium sp.]
MPVETGCGTMKLKSREELIKYREEAKKQMLERSMEKTSIFVGMGTCGIAAGAREVMAAILEEVNKRNLQVNVIQTGCIGMCEQEPLVDVQRPGEDRITYRKVRPSDVPRIIVGHVMHGKIVEDLAIARFEEI